MSSIRSSEVASFRRVVRNHWKQHGRHDLPWRKSADPYRILVSEVMLQQTQVPRVLEKYKEFLKKFPTIRTLAKAPLSDVLKTWNGLGYNRRGKYLHDAAKEIVRTHKGVVPKGLAELRKLSGMGPYTASAVRVFAYDLPDVLIETNIRAAYIHHFKKYQGDALIHDAEIAPIAALAAEGRDPREWHWALMDYGAYLKKSGVRNTARSAHYAKQPKFKGSRRQIRGEILRQLHKGAATERLIHQKVSRRRLDTSPVDASRVGEALAGLARDGLVRQEKGKWRIA